MAVNGVTQKSFSLPS